MAARVVACHQPNFLPWLGFFAKIARADVFVLLDDVQFSQGANRHNWTTRVRAMGTNGPQWLSVPVRRAGEGRQRISEVQIEPMDRRWLPKMLKTLESSYSGCDHFREIYSPVRELLEGHDGRLCALNTALIELVCRLLQLDTQRVPSSKFGIDREGSERLVSLTKAVGGSTYLAGDGAEEYEAQDKYAAQSISLQQIGFRHPRYAQRGSGEFVAGLSIFDALSNIGVAATRELLREWARPGAFAHA